MMNNVLKNRILAPMNLLYKISPKLELQLLYKLKTGRTLNLNNPVTFTEKIQWIKLYEKNELMPICCDKFLVRKYIEDRACGEILNKLLWEGSDPADIPFDDLPDAFAIKVTHGSTFNIICENKQEFNRDKAVAQLNKWLKAKFLPCYGEWFYGVEKPRIVVEKYLEDKQKNALFVYEFYCFHGEPKLIGVKIPTDERAIFNVYNVDFKIFPNVMMTYENNLTLNVPKPHNLEKMLDYARKLSKNFSHVRVDLYNIEEKIIFGELTFTQSAGFSKITPQSFDVRMGSWLTPSSMNHGKEITKREKRMDNMGSELN